MSVDSIKHNHEQRPHIPSQEEAGTEQANPAVRNGQAKASYPKNPVVHRGQDPELFWLGKYGADDTEDRLKVDVRSLYRTEHVAPETLIQNLYRVTEADPQQPDLFTTNELFGNALERDELEKVSEYYQHQNGWTNRLIQGDSLLVMASLLEREGFAGKVQTIYIDPPYGIAYGSNWQMQMNSRKMGESNPDKDLSGEPEVIKAYRDTWELGIHSYLSYLRDRLLIARELLTESGSCFVQISDENVHLVRCLMDEVFGSECHVADILVKKKGSQKGDLIKPVNDYLIWYGKAARESKGIKFRPLFEKRPLDAETLNTFNLAELPDGTVLNVRKAQRPDGKPFDYRLSPKRLHHDYPDARLFTREQLTSGGERKNQSLPFVLEGVEYSPGKGRCWKTRNLAAVRLPVLLHM